jgi:GNAT superfamily N-acetyltransferase
MNPPAPSSHRTRRALQNDAVEIARLSTELGYPASAPEISTRLALLLVHPAHCVFVAGEENDCLLGWIALEKRLLLESGSKVEIVGLVVDRKARRHGIGKALVAAAEEWARDQGMKNIFVRSNVVRPSSHSFYENLGYRRAKTQHFYLKELTAPGEVHA